jgi:NTE family protein
MSTIFIGDKMSKKLGFALGAGGSRGVAHVGFLKAMEEEGIVPDFICGCSMGSVVGGCYALGHSPEFMEKEVAKLKLSHIFDLSLNPVGDGALLRAKKVRTKLATYIHRHTFNEAKIPFSCVAVDLLSGKTKVFSGDEKILDGVVASSSIPGVFKPMQYKDMLLIDGGVSTRVPIDEVRDMGAEVVVAVDVLGAIRPTRKKYHIASLLIRASEVYDCELTKYKLLAQKPDFYLTPDLGDMSQFKLGSIEYAVEAGYKLGKEYAPKIKEAINKGKKAKS